MLLWIEGARASCCSRSLVSKACGSFWSSPALPLLLALPQRHLELGRVCKTHAHLPLRMQRRGASQAFVPSICGLFLPEDKGENVKPSKTTSVTAKKCWSPFKTEARAGSPEVPRAQSECSVGRWHRPSRCQTLWGWITVSPSRSDILRAAGCHGMATQGRKPLQSREKTNFKKTFQTVANKVSLALCLGMAPKSSLSPSDKALQPEMRVRCVGGVHVSVSGLENMCTVVARKSFLLWALFQKTSFLAFTTVPFLGTIQMFNPDWGQGAEDFSLLIHSLWPPGLGAASLGHSASGPTSVPRWVSGMGWSPGPWGDLCAALHPQPLASPVGKGSSLSLSREGGQPNTSGSKRRGGGGRALLLVWSCCFILRFCYWVDWFSLFKKSTSRTFATMWEFQLVSNERQTGTTTIKPWALSLPACSKKLGRGKKRANTFLFHTAIRTPASPRRAGPL